VDLPPVRRREAWPSGTRAPLPSTAPAQEVAYAAFRVVRTRPGEPDRPEITLPEGYEFVSGATYNVASRAEYYTFVTGPPNSSGIDVEVHWPSVAVKSVVYLNSRLRMTRDPVGGHRFSFPLPITRTSVNANQPTIQIWSYLDRSEGIEYNLLHNDPDRVAGPWLDVPWPKSETKSQIHQLFAAHAIVIASGLKAAAVAKGHRWFVQGFETNNTLHTDNPPHWHISYNSGPNFNHPTHNTHFWLDSDAKNFYNGMDVTGMGRLRHYVGDPAAIYDFESDANDGRGDLVATITIREDGGLDIAPPSGPVYAIAAGRDRSLIEEVTVLRDDKPWLRIETEDLYKTGVTTVKTTGLQDTADSGVRVIRYDPLTGALV
jgi:hypothetical protein